MRTTLWIAVSGFLLASGSAYAGAGVPVGHDDLADGSSPRRVDVTVADQRPLGSANDLSKAQPAEASSQEKAGASAYSVTVDPKHPGGLFPWGG